jgi:hypothetical protein
MVDIVINFNQEKNLYVAYEGTTDTILMTASLGDTFNKLEEHLKNYGLIAGNLLSEQNITYHIDSPTFIAMVKSNATLLKRLNNAPSGFMISSQRLGINNNNTNNNKKKKREGTFSKSNLTNSTKKLGMK